MPTLTKLSQEEMVLKVLYQAYEGNLTHPMWIKDGWVNKQYFIKVLWYTQSGRAIHNLEKDGIQIDHGEKNEFGFTWYKLKPSDTLF